MTPFWRNLLITIVVAAASGFAGARIGAISSQPPVATSPPSAQATLRQTVDAMLTRDFDLSSEQKAKIAVIDDNFTRQNNRIWAMLKMTNAELAGALSDDMTMNAMTQVYIRRIEENVGLMQTSTINYIIDIRNVLTPQQRELYDERIIRALMRDSP
jgi:hypothetical protein